MRTRGTSILGNLHMEALYWKLLADLFPIGPSELRGRSSHHEVGGRTWGRGAKPVASTQGIWGW